MTNFEKLYSTYFLDVFLYIKRLSHDKHLAEDITSEAFFKAMQSLDTFRGDCDVRVWLCQIAKNCYYSYLRKHHRLTELNDLEHQDLEAHPVSMEELLINKSQAMEIHTLLHQLPEPYKEVFMLRVFGELSFKQIGRLFQKTENWACVTYHRARVKIKERLEERNHEK